MFKLLKKLWRDRRGNALAIACAALPLIIGSAGLATDTIQWTLMKRQLQRAADSAALAGVYGTIASQTVTTGDCSASVPIARDLAVGNVQSRVNSTSAWSCAVQSPPSTGSWTATSWKAVRVTISDQRALAFTGFFMSNPPTITATATAAYVQNGKYCMISMDNKAEKGIDFTGNPTINLGCGLKTNAKGNPAVDCGGNATITASPVAAVGQITQCSNFGSGTTFQPYAPPQTDPYGSINPPAVPSNCNSDLSFGNGQNAVSTLTYTGTSSSSPTTKCYTDFTVGSGQTFTGTDLVIIINKSSSHGNSGNLTVQGTLNCTRCVFVLTSDSTNTTTAPIGNVTINASAHLNVSSPTSGTYNGILIYQDRRASNCGNYCNKINGDASSVIQGAIYMPQQEVQVNGSSGMTTDCLQLVAWQIQFSGTTTINNSCPGGPGGFDGYMVRLVE